MPLPGRSHFDLLRRSGQSATLARRAPQAAALSGGEQETMDLNGIWVTEIHGPYDILSIGVLVLQGGRACGGNNNLYSRGRYETEGADVKLTLDLVFYGPNRSLFGEPEREIAVEIVGKAKNGVIRGEVYRGDNLEWRMQIQLSRRADLPLPPL